MARAPIRAPLPSKPLSNPEPKRHALDDDVLDLTNAQDHDDLFPALQAGPAEAFSFLPTVFDSTGDLAADDFDPFGPRPAKKQRLSDESRVNAGNRRNVTAGGPGVLQPAVLRKWNATADPIETTSSPRFPPSSNTRLDISSDPFASSPRHVEKENMLDLAGDDDDPFASSPQTVAGRSMMPPKRVVNGEPSQGPLETSRPRAGGRGRAAKEYAGWDHISSSAPEPSAPEDGLGLDLQPPRGGLARSRSGGVDLGDLVDIPMSSDIDDAEFPGLDGIQRSKVRSFKNKPAAVATPQTSGSKPSTSKTTKATEKVVAREAEKRRKQREREETKEQKKREREKAAALAEVNKLRTDKKASTPEMIVDLPSSLSPSVRLQIERLLDDLNVKYYPYNSPVKNVVKWRRKVKARFNEDEGYWEPIPVERIEPENHAMVLMPAAEFVELALGSDGADLEAHVLNMQRHYGGDKLVYMIEGLTPWMRKNRNIRNRQFQSAVRSAGDDADITAAAAAAAAAAPPPSSQAPGRRKKVPKPAPVYIDEDQVEDALLQLQVAHGVLVHHTGAPVETAQWVAIFTQHISTIPYRRQRDAVNESAAFCMDSGQVRTGDSPADTYVRMLQEVARVTAPIAYGVSSQFPTVTELVRGLEEDGPLALEGIRKSANRDGAFTDRTIGQAVSRRIHKVFTGKDESSTDI